MSKIQKYEISLKCFLKNKKWETLIIKTPEWSSFNWMYDFPWWRIDEGEFETDYVDILKREILEETWLTNVEIINKVVAIWRHKVFAEQRRDSDEDNYLFYLIFEWFLKDDITPKISNEHNWYKWVKLEEIKLEDYFCSWYLDWAKMYLESLKV